MLGIFDDRTNCEGAIAGMLVGLICISFYIVGVKFYGMEPWLLGISAKGIGTVRMLLNFMVTLVVSRLTPSHPAEIQTMIDLKSD